MADLVTPGELSSFPGQPFDATHVTAAGEQVRNECGWHIAPTETAVTVIVDGRGGPWLILPTRHIIDVTSVTNTLTGATITGWEISQDRGMLYRRDGWPDIERGIEVVMDHGHPACPPELLPAVVERIMLMRNDPTIAQEMAGPFSRTLRTGPADDSPTAKAIANHRAW